MKKIFKFALASVVVAFAGLGIYQNMPQENTLSDFALENIEALTKGEGESSATCATGSKVRNSIITCPRCLTNAGYFGIDYFRIDGNMSTYRDGFEGDLYFCNCTGKAKESYTAVTKQCS